MTEALNTHGQIQPTSVETPRPSGVNHRDLSASLNRSRNLSPRQIAARLVLAGAFLGGGKLAMDTTPTSGQEPTAAPSFGASFEPGSSPLASEGPITGAIDPCATPTPEPTPTEPTRTIPPDIGQIPGENLIAMGQNSSGETVVVTLAQAAPSEAAASVAPESPAPTDPRTAAADCDPKPKPMPLETTVLSSILKQTNEETRNIKAGKLKSIMSRLWADFPEKLNSFEIPHPADEPGEFLTKKFTNEYLKIVLDSDKQPDERAATVGKIMAQLLAFYHYHNSDIVSLDGEEVYVGDRVIDVVDALKEFSVKHISPDLETDREEIAEYVENYSTGILKTYLSYPAPIS